MQHGCHFQDRLTSVPSNDARFPLHLGKVMFFEWKSQLCVLVDTFKLLGFPLKTWEFRLNAKLMTCDSLFSPSSGHPHRNGKSSCSNHQFCWITDQQHVQHPCSIQVLSQLLVVQFAHWGVYQTKIYAPSGPFRYLTSRIRTPNPKNSDRVPYLATWPPLAAPGSKLTGGGTCTRWFGSLRSCAAPPWQTWSACHRRTRSSPPLKQLARKTRFHLCCDPRFFTKIIKKKLEGVWKGGVSRGWMETVNFCMFWGNGYIHIISVPLGKGNHLFFHVQIWTFKGCIS